MKVATFKGPYWLTNIVRMEMEAIKKKQGYVTVADYNNSTERKSIKSDYNRGWTSLWSVKIVKADEEGMYELIMPKAELLEVI